MTKITVDTLLYNARIYTCDTDFSTAEAMAIHKGRVVALGSFTQLSARFSPQESIDLEGRYVYPGFIDAHCHLFWEALHLLEADLRHCESFAQVIALLQQQSHAAPASAWLRGRGWNDGNWASAPANYRQVLDQYFPEHPVMLLRVDTHAALVNTVALHRANITADTSVAGGKIVYEQGLLIDKAIDLVRVLQPAFSAEELCSAVAGLEQKLFAKGVTTVADALLDREKTQLLLHLYSAHNFRLRVYGMADPDDEAFFLQKGPFQEYKLHLNAVKLFADGALGSRGALMLQPYQDDPDNTGIQVRSTAQFREIIRKFAAKGFQVCTHCIGDGANRLILELYAEFLEELDARRWRIEHVQVIHPDDIAFFGRYQIIPSVQPTHCTSDMHWVARRIGDERSRYAYAWRDLLNSAGIVASGSDFPVEDINPLWGFHAAITRQSQLFPEQVFFPEQKLSRKEALLSMTRWASYACFLEQICGALETGRQADFVVLNNDLMTINPDHIRTLPVWQTWVDGKLVYAQ